MRGEVGVFLFVEQGSSFCCGCHSRVWRAIALYYLPNANLESCEMMCADVSSCYIGTIYGVCVAQLQKCYGPTYERSENFL